MKATISFLVLNIFLYSCSEYKKCKCCEDGSTAFIPRKPSKKLELYKREFELSLKINGTVSFLKNVVDSPVEISIKEKVTQLSEKISNETINNNLFLSYFFDLTIKKPCNSEYDKRFMAFLNLMAISYQNLLALRTSVQNAIRSDSSSKVQNINIIINSYNEKSDSVNIEINKLYQETINSDCDNQTSKVCFKNRTTEDIQITIKMGNTLYPLKSIYKGQQECFDGLPSGVYTYSGGPVTSISKYQGEFHVSKCENKLIQLEN